MLVLGRKKNEGITICHPKGPIHVEVMEIRRGIVRLGIVAEQSVAILRDEVLQRITQEIATGVPLHAIEDRLDHEENTHAK
jgi:carbon storage regulator CsrA